MDLLNRLKMLGLFYDFFFFHIYFGFMGFQSFISCHGGIAPGGVRRQFSRPDRLLNAQEASSGLECVLGITYYFTGI